MSALWVKRSRSPTWCRASRKRQGFSNNRVSRKSAGESPGNRAGRPLSRDSRLGRPGLQRAAPPGARAAAFWQRCAAFTGEQFCVSHVRYSIQSRSSA
jgi:hypothetical protein